MSLQRLVIDTGSQTAASFKSVCDLSKLKIPAGIELENYISSLTSGNQSALITAKVGAVQASATLTSTGTATAAETFTLCNVVFTARASGATGNEFNVSATVGTQAANIAAAINASSDLTGIVTATSSLGVVTITSVVPGLVGNGLQLSESLTNVTYTAFASGSDGTSYSIDLR